MRTPHEDAAVRAAETWFIDNGVPHFLERYSAAERWRSLITPLVVLVAFELGIAPWSPPTLLALLTAPPLVLCCVGIWRGYFRTVTTRLHTKGRRGVIRQVSRLVGHLILVMGASFALGAYLAYIGFDLGLTNATVNFLIIVLLLAASVVLLRRGSGPFRHTEPRSSSRPRWQSSSCSRPRERSSRRPGRSGRTYHRRRWHSSLWPRSVSRAGAPPGRQERTRTCRPPGPW